MGSQVLIIENNVRVRNVLSLILKLHGYEIATVESSHDALQYMTVIQPDLILIAANMPVMDGYEVCRWVRSNPDTMNIPVVMLSVDPENDKRRREVGADDFLLKPFRPSVMAQCVRNAMTRRAV